MKISEVIKNKSAAQRIIDVLTSAPIDEVFSTSVLESMSGVSADTGSVRKHLSRELKPYHTSFRRGGRQISYWGRPEAIAALEKLEKENHVEN